MLSLLACAAAPARAHHSFGAIYDQSREVSLRGVVKEFLFVHPHPFLVITVADDGRRTDWRAEMDNRFELESIGLTGETFRPGDEVQFGGSPGRTTPNTLYLWRLERPSDGLRYEQVGSRPYLRKGGDQR